MSSVLMPVCDKQRIRFFILAFTLCLLCSFAWATSKRPVLIGIDDEFGLENSISAQSIELGVRIAAAEINAAGGVLDGRLLEVMLKDNRSIPARGIRNVREFAKIAEVVAVLGGRFSPVVLEQLPVVKEEKLPFFAVWSSADPIVDSTMNPGYVFRASLRDSLAMPKMLQYAHERGFSKSACG